MDLGNCNVKDRKESKGHPSNYLTDTASGLQREITSLVVREKGCRRRYIAFPAFLS